MDEHQSSPGSPTDDSVTVSDRVTVSDGVTVIGSEALPRTVIGALLSEEPGSVDVLTTGAGTLPTADDSTMSLTGGAPSARRRGRRSVMLVAAGLVLTLLVGVGAYAAYRRFVDNGRRPEQFTPASVAVFVAVDLNAGLDQQLKLAKHVATLSRHTNTSTSADTWATDQLTVLLGRLHLTGVDVKRDIMSWLGQRAAVSVWMDNDSHPYVLISATTRDDSSATAGLTRVKSAVQGNDSGTSDLGFVVHKGAALIAIGEQGGQRAAEAASAEAEKSPLDGLASFRTAMSWLGGGHVAIIWTDAQRLNTAAGSMGMFFSPGLGLGTDGGMGPGPGMGEPSPSASADASRGTSIAGIRATDDGFEARFRGFNSATTTREVHDALARLSDLPANTEIGAVLALPAQPSLSTGGSTVNMQSMALGLLMSGVLLGPDQSTVEIPTPGPTQRQFTEAELAEIDSLLNKNPADLTDAESKRLKELIGYDPKDMSTPPTFPTDEQADPFGPWSDATIVVALTHLAGGSPSIRLLAEMASADAAAALAKLGKDGPDNVTVTVANANVTMVSNNYVAGSGRLADESLFQKVMAGAPAQTDLAVYIDLESALTAAARLKFPVRAVGLIQGREGGDETGLLRIIID